MIFSNKKSLRYYLATVFIFLITNEFAQTHVPVYREIIIELPHFSPEKNLSATVQTLIALGGIKYEGYCDQMKCLLLSADENIHPDDYTIMTTLKNMNDDFFIKPSRKIHQVLENCKDHVVPDPVSVMSIPEK